MRMSARKSSGFDEFLNFSKAPVFSRLAQAATGREAGAGARHAGSAPADKLRARPEAVKANMGRLAAEALAATTKSEGSIPRSASKKAFTGALLGWDRPQ